MTRMAALFIFSTTALSAQTPQLESEMLSSLQLRNIGPATMSGRIVDLAVSEKDSYIFYVASATGGLWKTTNNGVTFSVLFDDQPVHSIGAVAVHAQDDDLVWVGTGERANRQSSSWGDGVYKSTDGGKSWASMGLKDSHHIGRIALHPTDPDIVYVAAMGHLWGPNEERGLYKSSDGGQTWQRLLYINPDTGVVDVALDPSDPDIGLRRRLRAPSAPPRISRRRARQRALQVVRRRAKLERAEQRPPRGRQRAHRHLDLPQRSSHRLHLRGAGIPL